MCIHVSRTWVVHTLELLGAVFYGSLFAALVTRRWICRLLTSCHSYGLDQETDYTHRNYDAIRRSDNMRVGSVDQWLTSLSRLECERLQPRLAARLSEITHTAINQ